MGGRVVRAYTIPVRNVNFPKESITYVEAPGVFNEEAFKAMDMALALAGEYGIRVVVPLLNNWQWMGGRPDYAAFRDKESDEFWTDPQLIEDFKKTIEYVLNRTNTITGVKYKDDKTIMAWETGNELQNPAVWGVGIGQYIKSIDQNHLLIDGFHAIHQDGHDVGGCGNERRTTLGAKTIACVGARKENWQRT
jgi:endo-1,4-beta-mannosidase